MDKLKLIKTVVCLLTFLLVFGTVVLLSSLYQKANKAPAMEKTVYSLEQPAGSTIVNIQKQDAFLLFLVKNGGLSDRVIVFNTETGAIETTIHLSGKE